jgi:signal transduction histidine kinase
VILVSARADSQSTFEALELGADDLISKPFGARELLARVRATLANTRTRSDAAAARARAGERARRRGELRALVSDLKAAQRRVAVAADVERRRIEQNLHDGAQQRLLAIRLELGTLRKRLSQDDAVAAERIESLRVDLDEALEELREIAHGLYPPLLASDGLEAAIRTAARRAAIDVRIVRSEITRAPRSIESAVYFCCLEALQNAAKHAGPGAQASVEFTASDGALQFKVGDDGVGFDQRAVRHGYGLINLRDRVEALGGRIEVVSAPGAGTTVRGEIPLP